MEVYLADDMPPIAGVGENITIWTQNRWDHYQVDWLEQLPRGEALMRNFGTLAANTTGAATVATELQLDEGYMVQIRFEPVDDFEVLVWQLASQGRYTIRNIHCNVSRFSAQYDPHWKQTLLFILGKERDARFQLRNVTDYALAQTRMKFWGWRFNITKLDAKPSVSVWIPGEGRG